MKYEAFSQNEIITALDIVNPNGGDTIIVPNETLLELGQRAANRMNIDVKFEIA